MKTFLQKATGRSLILAARRAGVRLGAHVAPKRTARQVAGRFFMTQRPDPVRRRFSVPTPRLEIRSLPDGDVATYHWGDTGRAPTVLLVHGWNGWAQQLESFVPPLRERGFAVLAFDHVAHGASAGERATLPMMIRSVRALLSGQQLPAAVIAHSLGAAAVAGVLAESSAPAPAAVLIAPPTDPRPFLHWVARMHGAPDELLHDVQREAEAIAGVPMSSLVADAALVSRIAAPLLVAHDARDDEVPIRNGELYARAAGARLLVTHGLGHRRILRDRHVVDAAVEFVAELRAAAVLRLATSAPTSAAVAESRAVVPPPRRQQPVSPPRAAVAAREHREMLADVGAMA
jgi:pimeloyl-ACP methyl ester carboxylesterase